VPSSISSKSASEICTCVISPKMRSISVYTQFKSKYAKSPIKAVPQSVAKPTPLMESQHTQLISRDGTGPGIRTHFQFRSVSQWGPYTHEISTATHIAYGALSLEPFPWSPCYSFPSHIATCECGNNNYVWSHCALHYSLLHYSIRI
jgi:hypothetical protein